MILQKLHFLFLYVFCALASSNKTEAAVNDGSAPDGEIGEEYKPWGWKLNIAIVVFLLSCSGTILAITWLLRYKIQVHNRQPKALLKFKMSNRNFGLSNPVTRRISTLFQAPFATGRMIRRVESQDQIGAKPRNIMGPLVTYANGQKRDSWDTSRDSFSGGPRGSWSVGPVNPLEAYQGMFPSQQPRLSPVMDQISDTSISISQHGERDTVGLEGETEF